MENEIIKLFTEGVFELRRSLLSQVAMCDRALEKLTTINEEKKVGNQRPNPNECDHKFVRGACEKCGIYEEVANKSDIIKEADKPE